MSTRPGMDLEPSRRDHIRAAVHWLTARHGTQREAAQATGIHPSRLAVYGSRSEDSWRIAEDLLGKLAAACGVDMAGLLAGKGPKPNAERRRVHQVRAGRAAGV